MVSLQHRSAPTESVDLQSSDVECAGARGEGGSGEVNAWCFGRGGDDGSCNGGGCGRIFSHGDLAFSGVDAAGLVDVG